jgi:hypothetical protein
MKGGGFHPPLLMNWIGLAEAEMGVGSKRSSEAQFAPDNEDNRFMQATRHPRPNDEAMSAHPADRGCPILR